MARPLRRERQFPLRRQPHQIPHGGQELDRGLRGQRLDAAEVDLLLDQPVRGEGEGEGEGDPRRSAVPEGQHDHGREADTDGRPLHRPQPFLQQQYAHRDGDEGIDEVPERRLHHMACVHGPDVDAPVDGDHGRADGDERQPPRLPYQLTRPGPAPYEGQRHRHEDEGPGHPVGEDLDRPGGLQQGPEEGNQPPHPIRREAVQQSCAPITLRLPAHGPSFARSPGRARMAACTKVTPKALACHARIAIRS